MTTNEEDQRELREISKHATDEALSRFPGSETSLARRILLIFAALIFAANVVTSVYNTLILRQEIACERSYTNATNQLTDQSRTITKRAVDDALGGKADTPAERAHVKAEYDAGYAANQITRSALLATTCHDGSTRPPSKTTSTPPK